MPELVRRGPLGPWEGRDQSVPTFQSHAPPRPATRPAGAPRCSSVVPLADNQSGDGPLDRAAPKHRRGSLRCRVALYLQLARKPARPFGAPTEGGDHAGA